MGYVIILRVIVFSSANPTLFLIRNVAVHPSHLEVGERF